MSGRATAGVRGQNTLTAKRKDGLSGSSRRARAEEREGNVQRMTYIRHASISMAPAQKWAESVNWPITSQARRAANMEPRVQNEARTMTKGPREAREKNSEKYEKTTGNEPPTLRERGSGCGNGRGQGLTRLH